MRNRRAAPPSQVGGMARPPQYYGSPPHHTPTPSFVATSRKISPPTSKPIAVGNLSCNGNYWIYHRHKYINRLILHRTPIHHNSKKKPNNNSQNKSSGNYLGTEQIAEAEARPKPSGAWRAERRRPASLSANGGPSGRTPRAERRCIASRAAARRSRRIHRTARREPSGAPRHERHTASRAASDPSGASRAARFKPNRAARCKPSRAARYPT